MKWLKFFGLFADPIRSFTTTPKVGVNSWHLYLSKDSSEDSLRSSIQNYRKNFETLKMEKEIELLESGGDPFFITDEFVYEEDLEDDDTDDESLFSFGLSSIGGEISTLMIGDSNQSQSKEIEYEWNGEEDESAYFD